MKKIFFGFFLLLNISFISFCLAQSTNSAEQNAAIEIQKSHIDGNVPDDSHFNAYIKRDLEKYFLKKHGKTTVKWEFLRDGATQSGVSYPKYYLWIKIYKDNKLIDEGATRVAAIDKAKFDVTDYINIEEIKKNSQRIYSVFPVLVCERIKSKI
jgi:hypothetical protein